MTLHLVKMCVGIDDIPHLARAQKARRAGGRPLWHFTRNLPKRADELVDGGSLYWIIKGSIRVRQRLAGVERHMDEEGRPYCRLMLDPALVATELRAHKPIQGWRYLEPADAPPDLGSATAASDLPAELVAQLRNIGAW